MVITHFLFIYKSASFLFYFLEIDMKCWQMEKYKTSAKLGFWEPDLAIVLEVREAKAFVFECANSLKKLNGFYFYLLLECFEKKKKVRGFMASLYMGFQW